MTILMLIAAMFAADPKPSDADASSKLRVATFNIRLDTPKDGENRWGKRTKLVFDTIERMDPDLLGLQEALPNQFDALKAALPAYAFIGVGRNNGQREGEFVPVAFKTKRFEPLAHGHFWLSETPEKVGVKGWDAALPRIVTWVRLKERATGREVLFVNTHFDHMGKTARAESAKLLRKWVTENRAGATVVVTGDFNATDDQPPHEALVTSDGPADARLIDSYRTLHPQRSREDVTFHGFKGDRSGERIDWILHTSDLKSVSCEVVHHSEGARYPSDHYPVSAVLEFTDGAKPK